MNMTHPMGPRNIMITSHPILGLKGHRDPAGMRQGPDAGCNATCNIGKMKPTMKIIQGIQGDKGGYLSF